MTAAKVALGQAVQQARTEAGLSQSELAGRIGIDQPRLSRYIRGKDLIPYDLLPLIDQACRRPRGYVLRLAGFVDDEEVDLMDAIDRAKDIPDAIDRQALAMLYGVFRERRAE